MKTQLTAEQSANLISKGVSAERASEYNVASSTNPNGWGGQVCMPRRIFTLADLLSLLPKEITAEDGEEYYFICGASYPNGDWGAAYSLKWFDGDDICSKAAVELIDSLYSLLLWLLDSDYLNKE